MRIHALRDELEEEASSGEFSMQRTPSRPKHEEPATAALVQRARAGTRTEQRTPPAVEQKPFISHTKTCPKEGIHFRYADVETPQPARSGALSGSNAKNNTQRVEGPASGSRLRQWGKRFRTCKLPRQAALPPAKQLQHRGPQWLHHRVPAGVSPWVAQGLHHRCDPRPGGNLCLRPG